MTILGKGESGAPPGPAPVLFGTLSVLAVVPTLMQHAGGAMSPPLLRALLFANLAFAAVFCVEYALLFARSKGLVALLRDRLLESVLVALLLASYALMAAGVFPPSRMLDAPTIAVPAQAFLFVNLILRLLGVFKVAARRRLNYARSFGISFLLIIVLGTTMLWLLPGTRGPGQRTGLVDAFFTATSATCVTGLAVVDTGTAFSRFGQTVILALIQVGGLGLMTFAAFFAIALGKGMGLQDREVMKDVLNLEVMGRIVKVVLGILLVTFMVESVAAAILYFRWGGDLDPHERLYWSVFHSVSAFCNAGFGLLPDSLTRYARDPAVNFVIMGEIVLGGLGFGVVFDLFGGSFFARVLGRGRVAGVRPLGVQTKIVLLSSLILIVAGAALLYALESGNERTLGQPGFTAADRMQAALFQSVSARTAGFNTVPIGDLTDGSQFLLIMLMMIGASPGSTGGGIKTVTAVLLLLTVISLVRGRPRVEVFRRTIPAANVGKAVVIAVTAVVVVASGTFAVTVSEGGTIPFLPVAFEVTSAFGTVGLSTGITPALGTLSKLVLCAVMLIGRIGPLSLVIALSQAGAARRYEYPEESVMIG